MQLNRLLNRAASYFLNRQLPHGIINWRYLLPNPPVKMHIHRQLWLMGRHPRLPLILFLLIELTLWLRWVTFDCWRRAWHVTNHTAQTAMREESGKAKLLLRLLAIGLCHCIPPGEIIAFGLHRKSSHKPWDYIYFHETNAFHRWRDPQTGNTAADLALIQDKSGLTELLTSHAIPMAPILALIPRGSDFYPTTYLQHYSRIICKPCHGSACRDTFLCERDANAVFEVKNGMKSQQSTLSTLLKVMKNDCFLIQPFMDNHPLLAPLSPNGDAITVRIITEQQKSADLRFYCATLEIPDLVEEKYSHIILPINMSTGQIYRFPDRQLTAPVQDRYEAALTKLGNCAVPFWEELKRSALTAHRQLPGLHAIAWDYIITADSPRLLEGNSGWGATTPQILLGGLLQRETGKIYRPES